MVITNLNIILFAFQQSVVARGLEKKLNEMGNNVQLIIGDVSRIDECIDTANLFILNLPNKITEDTYEINTLENIGDTITNKGKPGILVGEKELWSQINRVYKDAEKFVWVFRPVEMNELAKAMEKALSNMAKSVSGRRILIVDDDPDYAKMVRGWIKDEYRVDIVTAGMQAITFLLKVPEDDKVDLILLDYEMPVVDGPQVLQMLRQEPATAHIPVVFLTGIGTRESVARVMSLKPDGYILKSTTREDLLTFLEGKLNH